MDDVLLTISIAVAGITLAYVVRFFLKTRTEFYSDYLRDRELTIKPQTSEDNAIRAFLYLDEYKMYSISSQVFEGLTDQILQFRSEATDEITHQQGPVASGRVLADIASQRSTVTESRFLHDYAYTLFEEKLTQLGRVTSLSETVSDEELRNLERDTFVRVSGPAVFTDARLVGETIKNYNEIGEALAYVSRYGSIEKDANTLREKLKQTQDRNEKARLREQLKGALNVIEDAQVQGLHMEPEFLKKLSFLLKYGFGDQLGIRISLPTSDGGTLEFSAPLTSSYLREKEVGIVQKYSRRIEKNIVLLGFVTQVGEPRHHVEENEEAGEPANMKRALLNLVDKLATVEQSFTGKLENEIVLDPIAIYRLL